MLEPRISVVTLGVDDLDRAVRFYEAMGLRRYPKITEGVGFFQLGGLLLALWPREELAKDIGAEITSWRRKPAPKTQPEVSADVAIAYNCRQEMGVGLMLAKAKKAGGRVLKPAQRAFWGGTQGYFADTEGNLWEVAHNPGFALDEQGNIYLP